MTDNEIKMAYRSMTNEQKKFFKFIILRAVTSIANLLHNSADEVLEATGQELISLDGDE